MSDFIEVVVLDHDGNKIPRSDGAWETVQIDLSQLGEEFQQAPHENIAVQQLVDQPGSVAVVLYDEVETDEKVSWSRSSVLSLIGCYKKNKARFKSGKEKRKIIWQDIVNEIHEETGQLFTCLQAQTKWKSITGRFREIMEHNSKEENAKKSCNYFAELLEVYRYKPNIKLEEAEESESFFAEDGSVESGDETELTNGALPMEEESSPPETSRASLGATYKWSRESVLTLLNCYKNNETRFKSSKHKKKHIWQEIADVIQHEVGQQFTWSQVEAKWKNLVKRYRDVLEHNSIPGNSMKTCSFFPELQEIFKIKPKIKTEDSDYFPEEANAESEDEAMMANGGASPMDDESIGRPGKLKWGRESVLVLIECYDSNKSKFRSSLHKKKNVWQDIADVICDETGQVFSWLQVEAKWKNLTKRYRDAVDHNSSTGKVRRSCSYFNELQRVYGYKTNARGTAGAVELYGIDNGSVESNDEMASEEPTVSARSAFGRKRQRCDSDDRIVEMLREMREENKALLAEQMTAQKKMHEEKMAMFGQLLDVLKTVVPIKKE